MLLLLAFCSIYIADGWMDGWMDTQTVPLWGQMNLVTSVQGGNVSASGYHEGLVEDGTVELDRTRVVTGLSRGERWVFFRKDRSPIIIIIIEIEI
jgi:hypothetical protein